MDTYKVNDNVIKLSENFTKLSGLEAKLTSITNAATAAMPAILKAQAEMPSMLKAQEVFNGTKLKVGVIAHLQGNLQDRTG